MVDLVQASVGAATVDLVRASAIVAAIMAADTMVAGDRVTDAGIATAETGVGIAIAETGVGTAIVETAVGIATVATGGGIATAITTVGAT
jgi:hypothetical protein